MDWKAAIFILQAVQLVGLVVMFVTLKFNDLKHLTASFQEFKKEFKRLGTKVNRLDKRVVRVEERLKKR